MGLKGISPQTGAHIGVPLQARPDTGAQVETGAHIGAPLQARPDETGALIAIT